MNNTTEFEEKQLLWRKHDKKAQKNGSHANIYWVRKQSKNEDGSEKASKWISSHKYVGDWVNNKKEGFGIQHYANGDKYEGGWKGNLRHGQGTHWVCEGKNRLRREYTGDWEEGRKKGRGTMFYMNGDRYDGQWSFDKPHGEGRMIRENGDVYEGQWFMGKRSGYGVMTKRNGDHFQGHWVEDKREGQGSYFFSKNNKVFVGEWVDDTPKTGIYSEVEDPYSYKIAARKHFDDDYSLPKLPPIDLENATEVLQESMEEVRKERTVYRAKFIPLDQLYLPNQLEELSHEFEIACSKGKDTVTLVSLDTKLREMKFSISQGELVDRLKTIREGYNPDEIDFELFARLIAIIMEEGTFNSPEEEDFVEDEDEPLES